MDSHETQLDGKNPSDPADPMDSVPRFQQSSELQTIMDSIEVQGAVGVNTAEPTDLIRSGSFEDFDAIKHVITTARKTNYAAFLDPGFIAALVRNDYCGSAVLEYLKTLSLVKKCKKKAHLPVEEEIMKQSANSNIKLFISTVNSYRIRIGAEKDLVKNLVEGMGEPDKTDLMEKYKVWFDS